MGLKFLLLITYDLLLQFLWYYMIRKALIIFFADHIFRFDDYQSIIFGQTSHTWVNLLVGLLPACYTIWKSETFFFFFVDFARPRTKVTLPPYKSNLTISTQDKTIYIVSTPKNIRLLNISRNIYRHEMTTRSKVFFFHPGGLAASKGINTKVKSRTKSLIYRY